MSDKYVIPQQLDEPFKLILWTLDELLAIIVPFLVLMLFFGSPIVGLIVSAACFFALKRLKGEQGHFFVYHLMYWYLPPLVQFKKAPPSCVREWIG